MKNTPEWKWFAWGKHPGIPDFICAGIQTPLFQRFTQWVDKGFEIVDAPLKSRSRHCSWRFWSKGAHNEVVCGVVRNSCDSYGRSFPLLFLGSGRLENWTENCTLLPLAFDSIWSHFEYVTAARYDSIGRLNEALQLIEPPAPEWQKYQQHLYKSASSYIQAAFDVKKNGENRLFTIACQSPKLLPLDLSFCNLIKPKGDANCPVAIFIGEIQRRLVIAVIEKIVHPKDFAWLWSDRLLLPIS
jgi:type VI secretion system ImpM family protein